MPAQQPRATLEVQYLTNSSEKVAAYVPSTWRGDGTKRAVISCHAAGGQAAPGLFGYTAYDGGRLALELDTLVLSPDLVQGDTWGLASVDAKITAHRTLAVSTFGAKSDKVVLFGGSMGGTSAALWASLNPTLTRGIGMVIPVLDTKDCRDNDRNGFATNINTAFGGAAAFDAAEPTRNPRYTSTVLAAAKVPVVVNAGTRDVVTPYAITQAWCAEAAATLLTIPGGLHLPTLDPTFYNRLKGFVVA